MVNKAGETEMFKDKSLLITGGTGSFGNAIIKKFLNTGIKEIRIFSRDEKKQDDMRNAYRNDKLKFYIGDVRDYDSIHSALHGGDYVFHAVALKQVPSCEFFPLEAIRTNAIGARHGNKRGSAPPFSDIPSGHSFDFNCDEGAEGLAYTLLNP